MYFLILLILLSFSNVVKAEPSVGTAGIYKVFWSSLTTTQKSKVKDEILPYAKDHPQVFMRCNYVANIGTDTVNSGSWRDTVVNAAGTTKEVILSCDERVENLSWFQAAITLGIMVKIGRCGVRKVYYPQLGGYKYDYWEDPAVSIAYKDFYNKYKKYEVIVSTP